MAERPACSSTPAARSPHALYAELTGERRAFADLAEEAKREEARTTSNRVERLRELVDEPDMADAVAASRSTAPTSSRGRGAPTAGPAGGRGSRPARAVREASSPLGPEEEAFAVRFQQTTGAIMAKGVEDTALYRYSRLAALNEVGSDPGRWARAGGGADAFSARNPRFPRCLLATQTHDTKRSGDVRARSGPWRASPASGASACSPGAR